MFFLSQTQAQDARKATRCMTIDGEASPVPVDEAFSLLHRKRILLLLIIVIQNAK